MKVNSYRNAFIQIYQLMNASSFIKSPSVNITTYSDSTNIYIYIKLTSTLNIKGIPIESLQNLGIIFDNSCSLHQNIMSTCRAAYLELRRIIFISHLFFYRWMLQRLSRVHQCFQNLTIAILYCLVLHSTSSNSFRNSKYSCLDYY